MDHRKVAFEKKSPNSHTDQTDQIPPPPRWEWPLTTGAPPSPRAAHSATRAGACASIFGGRHMETMLIASDLIIQLWRKVIGEM